MTRLRINGRQYTIRVYTVGQCFGTSASVRVGRAQFHSRVCPYGFTQAAIDSVVAAVKERYPDAEEITEPEK